MIPDKAVDPEPQPSDGPDYHTEHSFWAERQHQRHSPVEWPDIPKARS